MAEPTSTPAAASPTVSSPAEAATSVTPQTGLVITCQCGRVRLRTATPKPLGILHCHCTECQRQTASAFGTSVLFPPGPGFYPLAPELLDPNTGTVGCFTRPADSGNTMYCYFCRGCGVRLLHAAVLPDGSLRPALSVKGGAIEDPDKVVDWASAKHYFVRSAVIPMAPGWVTYQTVPPTAPTPTGAIGAAAAGAAAAAGKDDKAKAKTE